MNNGPEPSGFVHTGTVSVVEVLSRDRSARLEALRWYQIIDTPPEIAFDKLARLAALCFGTPIALINFVDENRQWFKSKVGLEITEIAIDAGFCPLTILQRDALVIQDTLADQRFANNPWVNSYPYIRFYAGVPLVTPEGHALGTICVVDHVPREFSKEQREALSVLSEQVMAQLALKHQSVRMESTITDLLHESEERFRRIFNEGPIGLAVVGSDLSFIEVNVALCDLLGYTEQELTTLRFTDITHPDDIEMGGKQLAQVVAEGKSSISRFEVRYVKKNKEIICASITATGIHDQQGKLLYGLIMVENITERKQVEKILASQAQELGRSNSDLKQFASVVSHDLREPLYMITSYIQLLAKRYKDQLDSDAKQYIAYALDGTNRMEELIRTILAYARLDQSGMVFKQTDCMTIFEAAKANLQTTINENRALITCDPLPTVMGHKTQLIQLFQNLIGNAVKYHNERPLQIHVSAERQENDWLFSIRDNGIGIDSKYNERIFLLHQRLKTGEKLPGTGIGLAICKKIVERHGGRIWMESQLDKGTTFYFTIPGRRLS